MINNKNIFITGGTGSFGKMFTKFIIKNFKPKSLLYSQEMNLSNLK